MVVIVLRGCCVFTGLSQVLTMKSIKMYTRCPIYKGLDGPQLADPLLDWVARLQAFRHTVHTFIVSSFWHVCLNRFMSELWLYNNNKHLRCGNRNGLLGRNDQTHISQNPS